jgi:cell division protein FtsW (lipid II flippase)
MPVVDQRPAGLFHKALALLRRTRLTTVTFIIILIAGVITESGEQYWSPLLNRTFGWDLTTVQSGKLWAAWLGLFFSVEPLDFYGLLLILTLTMGILEYRRGTRTAALGFYLIGPVASIITYLVLWPISAAGVGYVQQALYTPDMGSSTACLVCLGIFLTGENVRWRKTLIAVMLAVLAAAFSRNMVYNFDHFGGFIIGMITGTVISLTDARRKAGKRPGSGVQNSPDGAS